nr:hypothetical protein CFP56_23870 [Quercus suber]
MHRSVSVRHNRKIMAEGTVHFELHPCILQPSKPGCRSTRISRCIQYTQTSFRQPGEEQGVGHLTVSADQRGLPMIASGRPVLLHFRQHWPFVHLSSRSGRGVGVQATQCLFDNHLDVWLPFGSDAHASPTQFCSYPDATYGLPVQQAMPQPVSDAIGDAILRLTVSFRPVSRVSDLMPIC